MLAERVKELRENKHISQTALAELLDVTPQSVSKWERGQSMPNIETLCQIADVFEISLDDLLGRTQRVSVLTALPDDGKLRVVQCRGQQVLRENEYDPDIAIPLVIVGYAKVSLSVWGSVQIQGDIGGDVAAGSNVQCMDIGGDVAAKGHITCEDVDGDVTAGGDIVCGDIGGSACPGGKMVCGDVGGDACPFGELHCGDIGGNVSCQKDVHCRNIAGNISDNVKVVYVEK